MTSFTGNSGVHYQKSGGSQTLNHGAHYLGEVGFSPANVDNLYLWLDAKDSSTITTSGSNVTEWRDKSANKFVFSAIGTPELSSDNRSQYIDLNGTTDGFECDSTPAVLDEFTLFAVISPQVTGAAETSFGSLLSFRASNNVNNFAFYGGNTGSLTNETMCVAGLQQGIPPPRQGTSESEFDWALDQDMLVIIEVTNSGTTLRVNQNNKTLDLFSSAGVDASTDLSPNVLISGDNEVHIGYTRTNNDRLFYMHSKLRAMVLYDGTVSTDDRDKLEEYFGERYNIGAIDNPLITLGESRVIGWYDADDILVVPSTSLAMNDYYDRDVRALINNTSSEAPTTGANINGKSAITFDGSNDLIASDSSTPINYAGEVYVFFVYRPDASSTNGGDGIISSSNTFQDNSWGVNYFASAPNSRHQTRIIQSVGGIVTSEDSSIISTKPYLVVAHWTASNNQMWICEDGTTRTVIDTHSVSNPETRRLFVGNNLTGTAYAPFDLSILAVVKGTLSNLQINKIMRYMAEETLLQWDDIS